jgi:outer membrane protein TolC
MFNKLVLLAALPAAISTAGAQQPVVVVGDSTRAISLADAIRLTKENNYQAISGVNAIRNSTLNIRSSRAQLFYPTLSASAGQSKQGGERLGQSGNLVPFSATGWSYNTGVTARSTIFDGGKAFADTKKARADVAVQEAGLVTTNASLGQQVKTQYNNILAAQEQIGAGRAQLIAAQAQLEMSIAKVNAGAASVSDSLKSVVQVGNAQIAILTGEQNLRAANAALTRVVGTPYPVTAQTSDTVEIPKLAIDSATLVQMAIAGPTVKQQEASLTSAQAAERSAKSSYLPSISLNGTESGSGIGTYYGLNNNPYPYSYSIGLSLNFTIFQGFTRENSIAQAQISAENAQANIKDQKLAAQQTIVTQLGALRNADERIRLQHISVVASQEDLRVSQQRYALGAGTFLDVLNSQTSLIQAQQALIQARLDYRNARAAIEQVIGRDLP